MSSIEITEAIAIKILDVVDQGLSSGLGVQKPGQMCVEAAVCYALGLPHGDDPQCVSPSLRSLKIRLNDSEWSSKAARAKGLRRLAVAQLGSKGAFDEIDFAKQLADLACRISVPIALRAAASVHEDPKHRYAMLKAADRCEISPSREAASAAYAAANAASANSADAADAASAAYTAANAASANAADAAKAAAYAAYTTANAASANAADANACPSTRDQILSDFAEGVVQILIAMKAPGCQWLPLTELQAA
jgi:hypothetical protein